MEAYLHGVSTRKVDDLVRALGADSGISKSEVWRICGDLDSEVSAFRDRSLASQRFPYIFVDATYCKARVNRRVVAQAVVVASGVCGDGRREVLGFAVGDSEDGAFWTAFLRSLKARGWPGCSWSSPTPTSGCAKPSRPRWPAPPSSVAESTSSEMFWPGSPRAQRRWSPRRSARSSPSPTPPMSMSSWT
jgi:hypothetical protein